MVHKELLEHNSKYSWNKWYIRNFWNITPTLDSPTFYNLVKTQLRKNDKITKCKSDKIQKRQNTNKTNAKRQNANPKKNKCDRIQK